MKRILLILLFGFCFSKNYEDVVILKNGSEVHGMIIEEKPNEYIKIQSGENIFIYQMYEIELFKKVIISSTKYKDGGYFYIAPSIGIFGGLDLGYGSNKIGRIYVNSQLAYDWYWGDMRMWLIAMYEKPLPISDKMAITPSIGIGTSIIGGLNLEYQTTDYFHLKIGAKQGFDFIDGGLPFCATVTFGFTL